MRESITIMFSWWKVLIILHLDLDLILPQQTPFCQECIYVAPLNGGQIDDELVGMVIDCVTFQIREKKIDVI